MGTHPIFESDFDCLTDFPKMLFSKSFSAVSVIMMISGWVGLVQSWGFAEHQLPNGGWNPMEQVHDKVRRGPELEILPAGEKRLSKSTFWRMLGPNLQKIMTSK